MNRRISTWGRNTLIGFVIVFAFTFCGYVFFIFWAMNACEMAISRIKPPESVVSHTAWARAESTSASAAPTSPVASRPASFDAFAKIRPMIEQQIQENPEWEKLLARINDESAVNAAQLDNSTRWTDEAEINNARELCASNKTLIEEFRAIAVLGGPFQPMDFSQGFKMDMSHLSLARAMAQVLRVDAVCQANEQAYDVALEDIFSIMRIGDSIAQEPIMISQLVRTAIYAIAKQALTEVFKPGELTQDQTNRIIAHIRQGLHREAFADAILGEAMAGKGMFDQFRAGDVDEGYEMSVHIITSKPARPWLDMDETAYLDTMNEISSLAKRPYYDAIADASILRDKINNMSFTRVVTRSAALNMLNNFWIQARHETTLGLMESGLLVEQQIAMSGAAPESIAFVGAAAIDPYNGKPFAYHPEGATFMLYGLGPNRIDDGGARNKSGDMDDISWRLRD